MQMNDPSDTGDPSLKDLLVIAIERARTFAKAEMTYLRSELDARSELALPALAMIGVAAVLAFGALIALLVALILALTPITSLIGATFFVCGGAIILAFILFRLALARLKNAFKPLDDL